MGIFSSKKTHRLPVKLDMHNHLIPGIDDGSDSVEESRELIRRLYDFGYRELIMTPHIMGDHYKNTPEIIEAGCNNLNDAVKDDFPDLKLAFAAEYYIDEWFRERVKGEDSFLTFGDNFLLVETSYINKPHFLDEVIFDLRTSGYRIVLAHPERYGYMYGSFSEYETLFDKGVLFQINLNSLSGYYSPAAKRVAEKLVDKSMVHFVGTDAHGHKHLDVLEKTMKSKYFGKLSKLDLFNNKVTL